MISIRKILNTCVANLFVGDAFWFSNYTIVVFATRQFSLARITLNTERASVVFYVADL